MTKYIISGIILLTALCSIYAFQSDNNSVIIFTADWCPSCRVLKNELKQLAEAEKKNIIEVTPEDNKDYYNYYKVSRIPTIIVVNKERKEVRRHTGSMKVDQFRKFIND